MLIFFTKVKNPSEKDQRRFNRIKLGMGKLFTKIKKEKEKEKIERIIMKSGQNWFAVFQFRQ